MAPSIELSDGRVVATMMSAGVALYPDHASDASGLLRAADAAMYRAKRARPGSWQLAEESRGRRGPSFHAAGEAAAVGWRSARDARAIEGSMMNNTFPVGIGRMCVGSALLLCMLLGGCTTPPLHRGLTQTQVTALKSAGFQETQQGFEFGSTGPILFDFDRYNLKPDVRRIVERIGRTLHSAGSTGYGSMAIRMGRRGQV